MYCPKCGAQNAEGNKICGQCGAALTEAVSPASQPTIIATKTSGMAIASLVMGILGVFFGLFSILAIIFGAIALSQINQNPNLGGKGQAIAGLVLGIVIIALGIIATIIILMVGASFWNFTY